MTDIENIVAHKNNIPPPKRITPTDTPRQVVMDKNACCLNMLKLLEELVMVAWLSSEVSAVQKQKLTDAFGVLKNCVCEQITVDLFEAEQ